MLYIQHQYHQYIRQQRGLKSYCVCVCVCTPMGMGWGAYNILKLCLFKVAIFFFEMSGKLKKNWVTVTNFAFWANNLTDLPHISLLVIEWDSHR